MAMKVLEFLSEALPLVFLSRLFYPNKVEAFAKENAMNSLNGVDFHNVLSAIESENKENGPMGYKNGVEHSRAKRFIAFPVGSSFSTAVCLTTGVIGNPVTEYLSMGLNWGIAYDLPNSTWVLQHANGFDSKDQEQNVSPQIKRRHRRNLYGKLEILINGLHMPFLECNYTEDSCIRYSGNSRFYELFFAYVRTDFEWVIITSLKRTRYF